ncbi:hypothetical protein ATEIFO6365_0004033600 [Aspergillus terreus]|uniref:Acyltransferase 3 domain-containing protein n=1 Tax=Aspergillus terreus TaxID=33178 RepID=A0A5M3YP77_ASPTE|nr:hypothetical protein ATETN484_0002036100 [Aspergillus terreus]GFF15217.1 hypothetical protein ATEIFO6365_0004033600 [Aspergillus terreus]
MDRTAWLDGLRGIAAAIVALDHYFMGGVLDVAFRSYWAEPREENSRIIQLFPLRIFFAAHAMVPLFFVISGFALSINLIRARDGANTTNHGSEFARRLASAATRRPFRIYLPVFVIAIISQLLYFCNLYSWSFGDEVVWGRRPWTAPMFHLQYLGRYLLDITNCIQFHDNPGLNGQLWTMPFEIRGSFIIYLTVLALAFWKPSFRRGALVAMMVYFFYYGLWDIFGFLAGLYLAEIVITPGEAEANKEWDLPFRLSTTWGPKFNSVNFSRAWTIFCFIFGLYLVCLSDDGYLPPGYQFLKHVQSSRWDDDWAVLSKSWKCMGSFMLVYAISKSALLQRPLTSDVVQYLGKISFSLYLVHQTVYHLGRDPMLKLFWLVLRGEAYPDTETAKQHIVTFGISWLGTFLAMAVIVIYLSDVYTRYVDVKCVQLARRIEKWVTR